MIHDTLEKFLTDSEFPDKSGAGCVERNTLQNTLK